MFLNLSIIELLEFFSYIFTSIGIYFFPYIFFLIFYLMFLHLSIIELFEFFSYIFASIGIYLFSLYFFLIVYLMFLHLSLIEVLNYFSTFFFYRHLFYSLYFCTQHSHIILILVPGILGRMCIKWNIHKINIFVLDRYYYLYSRSRSNSINWFGTVPNS